MKSFLGAKARQLNHYTILLLDDSTYDASVIHIYVHDLLSNVEPTNNLCKDIDRYWFKVQKSYIGMIFVSTLAYSSKVNPASIQQWNGLLFDECRRNCFKFVDNGSVSETDLWTDRIHLIESGKGIIANNLINSSQYLTYQFSIRSPSITPLWIFY